MNGTDAKFLPEVSISPMFLRPAYLASKNCQTPGHRQAAWDNTDPCQGLLIVGGAISDPINPLAKSSPDPSSV